MKKNVGIGKCILHIKNTWNTWQIDVDEDVIKEDYVVQWAFLFLDACDQGRRTVQAARSGNYVDPKTVHN